MGNKAVIFDMDGVLIDSWELHYKSWFVSSKKFGFAIDRVRFGNHFGQTCDSFASKLCAENGVELSQQQIDEWLREKDEFYRDEFCNTFIENKSLTELLMNLHSCGFEAGIGSSAPKENIQALVDIMPLGSFLRRFISAADVSFGKPNPEVFLLAADKVGVEPNQCAVIEDSIHGLQAAKSAGMVAIGVVGTFTEKELEPYADIVVQNLAQVEVARVEELIKNN